jgi:hypothetical protein
MVFLVRHSPESRVVDAILCYFGANAATSSARDGGPGERKPRIAGLAALKLVAWA